MRKLTYLPLVLLVAAGCGGSSNDKCTLPDAGTPADMTAPAALSGKSTLVGVTSDDQIVYVDEKTSAVMTMPVAGGASQTITTDTLTGGPWIAGKMVIYGTNMDQNTGAFDLSVWTASAGSKQITTGTTFWVGQDAAGGEQFLYADHNGDGADLSILQAGGTTITPFKNIYLGSQDDPGCAVVNASLAGASAFISHCAGATADAGANPILLTVADSKTGQAADLPISLKDGTFLAERQGTEVMAIDETGNPQLVKASGGQPVALAKDIENAGSIWFTPDGSALLYDTAQGYLRRISFDDPTTIVTLTDSLLVEDSIFGSMVVPPTFSHAFDKFLFSQSADSTTGYLDLYVGDAVNGGDPVTLSEDPIAQLVVGDTFSADDSHVLYLTNAYGDGYDTNFNYYSAGDLSTVATAGGASTALGSDVYSTTALAAGKVLFYDNFALSGGFFHGNLNVVDTAAGGSATLVAVDADSAFLLNTAKDKVIYTRHAKGAEGIYVAPLQ